jgi:hypothetical protein
MRLSFNPHGNFLTGIRLGYAEYQLALAGICCTRLLVHSLLLFHLG